MNKSNNPEGVTADNSAQPDASQVAASAETPDEKKRRALAALKARS